MRKLFAALAIFLCASVAQAQDWWIEALGTFNAYSSNEMQTDLPDDMGIKLRGGYKWVYGWLSYDQAYWRIHSQGQNDMENLGFGVGVRVPIVQYFYLYGEFGRFALNMDNGPFYNSDTKFGNWEGIYYKMRDATATDQVPNFTRATVFVENTFGGQVGAVAVYPLMPHVALVGDIGYRWWRPTAKYNMYMDDVTDMRYQADETLNMDSWQIGVGLQINF